ncbi:hypothetical protein [Lactococcus sp. dk322]|uniref:hypothetical protein n=1 Tax=Lactococcus sp. dk322 TaxID=2603290 RepID=UPI0011CBCF3B|nr:hypothetical protein [Lactococcus sp. dk322]TXK45945.1 hypothetical protein FVP43_11225 [Lactococcus sp. dk322]
MKKSYEKIVCSQCGGNEVIKEHNRLRCAYCHTIYEQVEKKKIRPVKKVKSIKKKPLIAIFSLLFVFYLFIFLISLNSKKTNTRLNPLSSLIGTKKNNYESSDIKGLKNISSIKGWSESIYKNIEIAKPVYNENGQNFTKGTKYSDLVAQVGQPSTIQIWGYSEESQQEVRFKTNTISRYNVSISISYDKESNYITNKTISGYESYTPLYSNKNKENSLSFLGWSEALYNSIDVSTTIIDHSNDITTYKNGVLISTLLKKVSEPNQINHETDDSKNKITRYKWRDDYLLSITIIVDDATGQIIEKSIF